MGCGGSTVNSTVHHFDMTLYKLEISEDASSHDKGHTFKFVKEDSENCEIKTKVSLLEYIKKSTSSKISALPESKSSRYCTFFLKYCGTHKYKPHEFVDAKGIIPYDEMIYFKLSDDGLIEKFILIDMLAIKQLQYRMKEVLPILRDEAAKQYKGLFDSEIIIPVSESEKLELEANNLDENNLKDWEKGAKLSIYREMTKENIETYREKIKSENLVSVHIRKNHFKDMRFFKEILEKISKIETVRSFNFNDNFNTTGFDKGWKLITNFFYENNSVREINLCMGFIYDKFLYDLLENGIKSKKIVYLDLSCNFITVKGCKFLAEWLKKNKILRKLNLQQNTMNEFKKEGSDVIVEAVMHNTCLEYLDLSNMIITGFGEKLAELIKTTKSLTTLKIENTRMNLDDFRFVSDALKENQTITDLNLCDNFSGSNASIRIISNFIAVNKTIKIINIHGLGISKHNCEPLFKAIDENETIEDYTFGDEKMKFALIHDAMVKKKCLKILQFRIRKKSVKVQKETDSIDKFKQEREDVLFVILKT